VPCLWLERWLPCLRSNEPAHPFSSGTAALSIGHVDRQNASLGAQIVARGSGFDSATAVTVGGQAAPVIFTDENTLALTIPGAASRPPEIVLAGSDRETYTRENAVDSHKLTRFLPK